MRHRYLITGLPRMRSAWLAAILSTVSETSHETRPLFSTREDLQDWLLAESDTAAGIVSPAGLGEFEDGRQLFDGYPVVFIRRQAHEARTSFNAYLGEEYPVKDWLAVVDNAKKWKARANLVIDYEDLEYKDYLDKITDTCKIPRVSEHNWRLFNYLNIQQHKKIIGQ